MYDLIKDLASITTIPEDALNKLVSKTEWCICDCVNEKLVCNNEKVVEINIGIGTLSLIIDDNSIIYRFVPSKELEKYVIDTIKNEKNPLKYVLEKNLINKITKVYKELIHDE